MAELEVENLRLRFGGLTVLDGLTFAVEPAELFALIGPNGAGKTSAFNCISRIYRGDGRIRFRGLDISGLSSREVARLGIARTFQHVELFLHMSVLDNIMTGRHARLVTNPLQQMLFLPAVRREEVQHRAAVERINEFVELEGVRHAPAGALPLGTQKVVGLARALALEPTLLLLDEPSAGLDPITAANLDRTILTLRKNLGVTFVVVTHELQSIFTIADRAIMLDPHTRAIIADDAPTTLRDASTDARVHQFFNRQPDALRAEGER